MVLRFPKAHSDRRPSQDIGFTINPYIMLTCDPCIHFYSQLVSTLSSCNPSETAGQSKKSGNYSGITLSSPTWRPPLGRLSILIGSGMGSCIPPDGSTLLFVVTNWLLPLTEMRSDGYSTLPYM